MKSKGTTAQKRKRGESAPISSVRVSVRWPVAKLAGLWGLNSSTLYGILVSAGLDGGEGFDLEQASTATIAYFKTKSEQTAKAGDEAATRKKIAEAEMSEIELEKKLGTLVSTDECRRIFEAFRITTREMIRANVGMSHQEKNELCDRIAAINPFDEPAP